LTLLDTPEHLWNSFVEKHYGSTEARTELVTESLLELLVAAKKTLRIEYFFIRRKEYNHSLEQGRLRDSISQTTFGFVLFGIQKCDTLKSPKSHLRIPKSHP
jgi:hypothetical protein